MNIHITSNYLHNYCAEAMPCLAQEYHPRLPTSNHCKSLSSLIRETYVHCHVPCVSIPSAGWSSDDDDDSVVEDEFDTKQVILNEIRNRQMKKRSRSSMDSPSALSNTFIWSFTPLDPRSVLEKASSPEKCMVEKAEGVGDGDCNGDWDCDCDADDESEAFFSVKSFLSRSTSRAATVASNAEPPPPLRSPAMWEGFLDCEGWPFGLCRRAAVVPLPPLPSSPVDSWKWRKRSGNFAVKPDRSPSPAYSKQRAAEDNNTSS